MPVSSARRGQRLEVWGCLRPAPAAVRDTGQTQTGYIEFRPAGQATFTPLATKTVTSPGGSCYFDLRLKLPSSGTVRLAYVGPAGAALVPAVPSGYSGPLNPTVSRQINVIVH